MHQSYTGMYIFVTNCGICTFILVKKKVHVIVQVVTMMYINLTLSVCTVSVKLHYNEYSIFIVHKDRCLKLHFSDRYSWRLG